MSLKDLGIVAGVVVALVLSGVAIARPATVEKVTEQIKETLGAFPGGEIFDNIRVNGTFTSGGDKGIATSTTATSYTVVQKDLEPYSMIDLMLNTGSGSLTLPATSTMMAMLKGVGASRTWLIHNATTTTGITLTLVTGAGMDLVAATVNDDVIDPGEYTRLTCTQIPYRTIDNENIACIVDELTNAD